MGSQTQVPTENKLSTGEVGIVKSLGKCSLFREGAAALPQPAAVMRGVCVYMCARVCVLGLLASLQTGNPIFKKYLFLMYLAVPGLSCSTRKLSLRHSNSWLRHVGSSSLTGDQTPGLLHWEHGVLASRPPRKSPNFFKIRNHLTFKC